jgi:Domain of unknown function (DUF5659)
MTPGEFSTDKIGLACFLMIKGAELTGIKSKSKGRAVFLFKLSPQEGLMHETAYTTSDHSRFFEAFKYLRGRALRGE